MPDDERLRRGTSDDRLATRMVNLAMRRFFAQHEPWTAESLNELAEGAERLLERLPTAGVPMLGPTHDPYLERWQAADLT